MSQKIINNTNDNRALLINNTNRDNKNRPTSKGNSVLLSLEQSRNQIIIQEINYKLLKKMKNSRHPANLLLIVLLKKYIKGKSHILKLNGLMDLKQRNRALN